MNRFAFLAVTCLALAACNDDPPPAETDGENLDARGEVLGGTINDDMVPLDTVTSQASSQTEESEGEESSANPGGQQETPAEAAQPGAPGEDDV